MKLICWLFGHKWSTPTTVYTVDRDLELVAMTRVCRCGAVRTSLMTLGALEKMR